MSGFEIEFALEQTQAQAVFDRLLAGGQDLSPLMAGLAEGMVHRTQDRIEREEAPDGTPWAPLDPAYAARKKAKGYLGGILVREGYLSGLLRPDWGDDFAEVATAPLPYAAAHQFGYPEGGLPQREYLGVGPDDLDWIVEEARAYLDQLAGG